MIQAIRLLTRFGQAQQDPNVKEEDLQKELTETDPNTRLNLQQLLGSLASKAATAEEEDTPLLMKAAEHMAIRFALERYQKGEVKVNAVHQMMEHMSRQMDSLRQILKLQEEKMSKAGILVESHADILDRMFWAEVPESGKKSVLLSHEAPCVPPRNLRQFVEVLLDRDDKQTATEILNNYSSCLGAKDIEPRRRTAIGLSQLADLYARLGGEPMGQAIRRLSEHLIHEKDAELQSLFSAAFVRLSQEASSAKNFAAVNEVCAGMETDQHGAAGADERFASAGGRGESPARVYRGSDSPGFRSPGYVVGVAADEPFRRRASGRPFFPLHAPRRMRSHDRTGEAAGISGAAAVARDSAHRAAAPGLGRSGLGEPPRCRDAAGIAAGAFAGMEPLLSRHCGAADCLWRCGGSRTHTAGTGGDFGCSGIG